MLNFIFAFRRSLLPHLSQAIQHPTGLTPIQELEGGKPCGGLRDLPHSEQKGFQPFVTIFGVFVNELSNHCFQRAIKSFHQAVRLWVVCGWTHSLCSLWLSPQPSPRAWVSTPSLSVFSTSPVACNRSLHANYCNQTQVFLILHLTHLLTAVSWVSLPLQTSLNHVPLATRRLNPREGRQKTESTGVTEPGKRQEEAHSRTQATAMMMAHGGADRGRSHGGGMATDSRGHTKGGGAGGEGARGGEPTSQGGVEDLGVHGGAECSAVEQLRTQVEQTGGTEPSRAGGTERRGAARGEASRGNGGSTPNQGGAGGMREPGGAGGSTGDGGGKGARSRGGAAGSTGWGGVQAEEAGGGGEGYSSPGDAGGWQTHGARTIQIGGWGRAGGLPDDSGGEGRSGWVGGHFRGSGTGGYFWRAATGRSGAPSLSSSPRCNIGLPSATVQGAELHSALTPSTACSLVMGTVTGNRTWSDGLGSISKGHPLLSRLALRWLAAKTPEQDDRDPTNTNSRDWGFSTQDNQGGKRDTPGIKLTIYVREKWGQREHMGSKTHTKQSWQFVMFLFVFPVFLFLKQYQFYQGWNAEHSAEHTTKYFTGFDYSDILLDIVVCKAVALVKRYRTHRQGKPSGALAKLHQRGFRTPLPSIYLAKLHSLPNKTDKLLLLSQTNKDLSNSAALFSHVKTPYIIVCIAYCVLPFCTLPICTFVYCYFVVCILLLSFCCTVELLSL